ncbi:MAG: ImmA/IrrE family metallo-endopeptidase [Myxococcota bacterium]|nr:ImmA/IrrE family metallo-endopeptidase [Myxococcota bacterium]
MASRNAHVRQVPLDGLAGRLVRGRNTIITVNSNDPPERRRFSIGHELGHLEMHAQLDQTYACTPRDMDDYRRSPVERQANHFAACLLMPEGLFRREVRFDKPSIHDVIGVAKTFGTSLTAAALRLVELSGEAAAVVMTRKTGIDWVISNPHFDCAIDRRLPRLNEYSFAYDAAHKGIRQEQPLEVDGDTWLYFDLRGRKLLESSVPVGAFGALSVLWMRER